jgi:cytochrome c biogenesis protein
MSVTRSKAGGLYRFLASLRFALILLVLIAAGSLLGTLIQQGAEPAEYAERYPVYIYKAISSLGLDDVYHAPWFYILIVFFGINLTLCTIDRFRRLTGTEKSPSLPTEDAMTSMESSFFVEGKDLSDAKKALGPRYKVRTENASGAVFEKGACSRYGVYIIHGSIIMILLGSLIGLLAGYRGFMMLWEGETKDHITLRGREQKEVPLGFALKCNQFKVSFYPGGEPKDYVSKIAVIDNNRVVTEKEIRVNAPLQYRGFNIYQATYGSAPIFLFTIGGEKVVLKENEMYQKGDLTLMPVRYHENIHNYGPGVLVAYVENGEPKGQWFLKNVERLREGIVRGAPIRLEDIRQDFYTGLEISRDPGVWVVWTGFALILLGLYATFFVQFRRIYVRAKEGGVIIAGLAPKNRLGFREEMEKLKGRLHGDQP